MLHNLVISLRKLRTVERKLLHRELNLPSCYLILLSPTAWVKGYRKDWIGVLPQNGCEGEPHHSGIPSMTTKF